MESKRLAGKTAVVTAAGSGIGRASAEAFARAGARVIAADIDAKALQAVVGCEPHTLDVRDAGAIAAFAKAVGKVDVLFNCAGSIINMSSVASSITGVPDRCAYGATKAAVIGLTKSVAADFVAQGVRCNAICPGTVDTPSLQARLHAYGDYAKTRAEFEARQPIGRLGKPEEIAALALHLASDESGFTTGQIHIADGGWMI